MPPLEVDLNPVDHVTADAIGKPGERVFYLQAVKGSELLTIIAEKIQLQSLAVGIDQFLKEIAEKFPERSTPPPVYSEAAMQISPPIEPLFRAGEIGLAYNSDEDLVILVVREIFTTQPSMEEVNTVRFWCSRSQIASLAHWINEISNRGRPICSQCGEPMEPDGHLCPKKNGHKK